MIQLLEERQRAENKTEVLKLYKEVKSPKTRIGAYKSYDKVKYEKDSILPTESTERGLETQSQKNCQTCEENFHNSLKWVSNSRDTDEGQSGMICSKEVRKDKESRKINIKVGKTHNVRRKKGLNGTETASIKFKVKSMKD